MSRASEFSRTVEFGRLGDGIRRIEANADERAALAKRFGLVAIDRLEADLALAADRGVLTVDGRLIADIVQSCAVSGEDLPVHVDEPVKLRFIPQGEHRPDEEVELTEAECDEIEYDGNSLDLGEAVAQGLALAIDPFAIGPQADQARKAAGILDEDAAGPFAALAALKPRK